MSEYSELVTRIRERARIRKKMRLEGTRADPHIPDRIAKDLDDSADAIEKLEEKVSELLDDILQLEMGENY